MHTYRRNIAIWFAVLLVAFARPAAATDFVLPLFDDDDTYFEKLLEAALNAADGSHTLKTFKLTIPQTRALRTMADGKGQMNVIYTGHSSDRERSLRQIDIPLTRGLFGYRIFVIQNSDTDVFDGINDLKGLTKHISVGSGTSWPDTTILRLAGFNVKTSTFANLWPMLERGRFQAFPRGLIEVLPDLKRYGSETPGMALTTENSVMLHYPFDVFFYVAPQDAERARVIEQGLNRLYENGEFLRIFKNDPLIADALADAAHHKRQVIELDNPLNSTRIRAIPKRYWHSFSE